ncbi:fungal hydrophobin [Colletotrichum sojae]|uniref:Fungal hydrophobin n=1 Tax=Colletotrichum sojae TaxID=2175907 RepID=A0A8H6MLX2_9PEZI|nr:fungal hydrophobin [Colletotrichum sojae]
MQFTTAIIALFASTAIAVPTGGGGGSGGGSAPAYDPCSGLFDTALCCATDVLGIAGLDCGSPPGLPTSPDNFRATCSAIGQRARCCFIPLLGQGLLCQTPAGVRD